MHRSQPTRKRQAGFTLLELLAVLVVVGVLVGAIVLSYTGSSPTRALNTHAERFMLAFELARQRSTLSSEVWGVKLRRDSYEFMRLELDNAWTPIEESPFHHHPISEELDVQTRLLGGAKPKASKSQMSTLPDIVIYPSGEVSPFEVTLTNRATRISRYVISDGLSRAIVSDLPYKPIVQASER